MFPGGPGSRARRRAEFTRGTRVLFPQSTVPVGYKLDTTFNDRAIRVVNTTGGGTGGSVAFSTLFGRTATDSFTLTTAEMPAHTHNAASGSFVITGGTGIQAGSGASIDTAGATASAGTGGGHTHGIDMRVNYVDTIVGIRQ